MDERERRADGRPLTSRGKASRDKLVLAARRVFETKGYPDTRIADIVAEAVVSTGTFYVYFDDKEAVFREIAETVVDDMHESLRIPDSGEGIYELIYQTHLRWVDAYRRNAGIIALIYAQAPTDPFMRELRLRLRERFIGPGARGLARFQHNGLADADIDPRLTLEVIAGMGDELCFQRFVLGRELTDEDTLLRLLTRLWLRAVGVDLDTIKTAEHAGRRARRAG